MRNTAGTNLVDTEKHIEEPDDLPDKLHETARMTRTAAIIGIRRFFGYQLCC